ncbi:hypothetical protein KBD08_00875 [Candidatus Babeliales bacterium]|nr:hypothetical protein [Candidatus Babeliales bacterium]
MHMKIFIFATLVAFSCSMFGSVNSTDATKQYLGVYKSDARRNVDTGDYGLCFDVSQSSVGLVSRLLLAVLHSRENNQ